MNCPTCKHTIEGMPPQEPGNWCVCSHCGDIAIMTRARTFEIATKQMECVMRLTDPRAMELVDLIRFYIQQQQNKN